MKWYYLHHRPGDALTRLPHLAHSACLDLSAHMDLPWMCKDIEDWRDKANPGDYFVIHSDLILWCLDFDLPVGERYHTGPRHLAQPSQQLQNVRET